MNDRGLGLQMICQPMRAMKSTWLHFKFLMAFFSKQQRTAAAYLSSGPTLKSIAENMDMLTQ
jgi:hypothetical protein